MTPEPPADRYGRALDELEAILAELEGDDLDVDVLAERVARAADLIGWCRDRLQATRLEVERIVVSLDETEADSEPDTADREDESDGPPAAP